MTNLISGRSASAAYVFFLLAEIAAAQTEPLHYVVAVPVADIYRTASGDSDVVSQAIFSSPVLGIEAEGEWLKIRTADQYSGWVRAADVRLQKGSELYGASTKSAHVASLFASLYREPNLEKHRPVITLPFESRLELTGEKAESDGLWYAALLPDGSAAWIQGGDLSFDDRTLSIPETIALARRFLGLPYRWGGTSSLGYDCSGYTQMLVHSRGVLMPRDSSVQAKWDGFLPVERTELKPGDILFFGNPTQKKVNHTGMYIGNGEFIHATRHERPVVQTSCLDDAPWTTRLLAARRLK